MLISGPLHYVLLPWSQLESITPSTSLLSVRPGQVFAIHIPRIMFVPQINAIGRLVASRTAFCLQTARKDCVPKNSVTSQIRQQRPQSTSPLFARASQYLHRSRQEVLRNRIPKQRRHKSGTARDAAKALFLAHPYSVTAAAFLYLSRSSMKRQLLTRPP
jgi:hypothetical protein